jgi:hypothetical protein
VERYVKVKAQSDYYGAIHYRRETNRETTLCGLKVSGSPLDQEVTCLACRDFTSGKF